MRCERLPSVKRSIHTKTSVHTVCGQAKPHQRRPSDDEQPREKEEVLRKERQAEDVEAARRQIEQHSLPR
jgi:hypothetical protein